MRMVVISLIVLIILIGVWIWFHFTKIEPNTQYYWDSLSDLSNKIDFQQWNAAEYDMINYSKKWESIRRYWVFFLNQDDIDNIDISIKRLGIYVKNNDKVKAQAELEHLKILFNIIKENECLSLDNIF